MYVEEENMKMLIAGASGMVGSVQAAMEILREAKSPTGAERHSPPSKP